MRRSKRKSTLRAFEEILKEDQEWSYEYLLIIECKKQQRIASYYEWNWATVILNKLRFKWTIA